MDELYDGFIEKTDYLTKTKGLLKDRINSLGGSITSGTTFRDYLVWLDSLYEALEEKTITGLPDSLEGKCEQEGTPTPTSPQPINITTGRQVVSVCGKNLANTNNIYLGKSINSNDGTLFDLNTRTTLYQIRIKPNTSYYVSLNSNYYIGNLVYYKEDKSFLTTQSSSWSSTRSFTTPNNAYYISFAMKKTDDTAMSSSDIDNLHLQLELGNQPTTYEEYKGNDYEINLGKNLVKSARVDSATSIYNVTLFVEADLEPSTTYTISFNGTNGNRIYANENLFTTGPYINITNDRVVITLTTKDTISKSDTKQYNSSYQKWVIFKNGQNEASANVYDDLMIEKGSQPTSYTPYKTPIYLGKIGTYQDYIFKNTQDNPLYDSNLEEGQWYIHKEIGRIVCTGASSEAWVYDTNNHFFVSSAFSDYSRSNNIPYCNYYKGKINVNGGSALSDNEIAFNNASTNRLYIKNTSITSASAFNTWLSTHNVEVYYVLNTPTNTLIEDEELINQLNEIEIFTVISEDFYN